jgi:SAM-dependent methyltransferase
MHGEARINASILEKSAMELGTSISISAFEDDTLDSLDAAGSGVFLNLRDSFASMGFNESNIRARYVFDSDPAGCFVLPPFHKRNTSCFNGLDVLIHLFMGQESLPVDCVTQSLDPRFFSELQEVGLLSIHEGKATATVRIEPVDDLLVCADRFPQKSSSQESALRSDQVYRPWDFSALLYTRIVPHTPCDSFLEMCCGSGYVCLTAAQHFAQSVYGVDINPRAIRFAEFNKRLNGIKNITTYCGNLFEPVQSKKFDRIVAHPPYVPALINSLAYRDGGIDGENISTGLIRGVPDHLSDGGEFHSYLMLSDRIDAPAELRVRKMLGHHAQEFDVALHVLAERAPASLLLDRSNSNPFTEGYEQSLEACRQLGILKFLSTVLTIRSRRGISPRTVRNTVVSWETIKAMDNPVYAG